MMMMMMMMMTMMIMMMMMMHSPHIKILNGVRSALNTVEPPESDQPKCNNLVVAYMRWSLIKRVELHQVFY